MIFDDNYVIILLISSYKLTPSEAILMSTHHIGFYEGLTKIGFELSSNIIKYEPYFFCCTMSDRCCNYLRLVMRKLVFCICKNKDADQLCGKRTADQRLCFRCIYNTIHLLPKSEISS